MTSTACGWYFSSGCSRIRKNRAGAVLVAAPAASEAGLTMLAVEPAIDRTVALLKNTEPVFNLPGFSKDFTPRTADDVVRFLSSVPHQR